MPPAPVSASVNVAAGMTEKTIILFILLWEFMGLSAYVSQETIPPLALFGPRGCRALPYSLSLHPCPNPQNESSVTLATFRFSLSLGQSETWALRGKRG